MGSPALFLYFNIVVCLYLFKSSFFTGAALMEVFS